MAAPMPVIILIQPFQCVCNTETPEVLINSSDRRDAKFRDTPRWEPGMAGGCDSLDFWYHDIKHLHIQI